MRFKNSYVIFFLGLFVFILVLLSLFTITHSQAQTTPNITPATPYTNIYWPGTGYTTREWEFTPYTETDAAYFWAHQQGFENGNGFYVGMQTADGGKQKLLLFSVWDAIGATTDGTNGGWCQTFGGEGVGYSCRQWYDWVPGRTYKFKVAKVDTAWWGAWVTDTVTGVQSYIGKVNVPATWGGLTNWSVMWTEDFDSPAIQTCDDTPYAKAIWGNPVSNGTILPQSYSQQVSQTDCLSNTKITNLGNNLFQQEVGLSAVGGGLQGTYYDNGDFTGTSVTRIDPIINFDGWQNLSPVPGIGPDTFSVRWTGQLYIPTTDTYTFYSNTDAGSRLWINNQSVLDNWGNPNTEASGSITLTGGQTYPITLEYFEDTGDQHAILNWSSLTITKRPISQFYLKPPPDTVPPSVSITYPGNNSTVNRNSTVTIAANASDNYGVTKVNFIAGGTLLCVVYRSPYTCPWRAPNKKSTVTLSVQAYDTSGNTKSSSIVVNVK